MIPHMVDTHVPFQTLPLFLLSMRLLSLPGDLKRHLAIGQFCNTASNYLLKVACWQLIDWNNLAAIRGDNRCEEEQGKYSFEVLGTPLHRQRVGELQIDHLGNRFGRSPNSTQNHPIALSLDRDVSLPSSPSPQTSYLSV